MVCVTGASGFIASWVVKLLLQRGYTVRATVRDPSKLKSLFLEFFWSLLYKACCGMKLVLDWSLENGLIFWSADDPKKMRHLMELDGAKQRLQLFKAELLEAGSFDPVVHGCRGVFHTASPVILSDTADPQVLSWKALYWNFVGVFDDERRESCNWFVAFMILEN